MPLLWIRPYQPGRRTAVSTRGHQYRAECADGTCRRVPGAPSIIIQNVQVLQPAPAQTYIPHQIKNPGVALLLSFIFPGGGQFYNGHAGKGILVLLTFWIFGISYIWSLFDAYSSAQRINRVGF